MKKYPLLIDALMAILLSVSLYMLTVVEVLRPLWTGTYFILTPMVFYMLKRKREKERDQSDK